MTVWSWKCPLCLALLIGEGEPDQLVYAEGDCGCKDMSEADYAGPVEGPTVAAVVACWAAVEGHAVCKAHGGRPLGEADALPAGTVYWNEQEG